MIPDYQVEISGADYRDAVSWLTANNYEYYSIPGPPWAMWNELNGHQLPVSFVFNDESTRLLFALRWA